MHSNICRSVQYPQDTRQSCCTYQTQKHCHTTAKQQGQKAFFSQTLPFSLAVQLRKYNGHTITAAIDDEDEQIHHTSGHAHSCERCTSHIMSDDHCVDRIIKLLQYIPHDQWQHQSDQFSSYISVQQILRLSHILLFPLQQLPNMAC